MAMTKDKAGNCVFVKDKTYTTLSLFNPVWPPARRSACIDVKDFTFIEDGNEKTVPGGQGLFTNEDDTRWWVASNQFDAV